MNYKDKTKKPLERAADLLKIMTIEEKIGQMCQLDGKRNPDMWIKEKFIGSFLHVTGDEAYRIQTLAEKETRLSIPLIFGIDAVHGHTFHSGATIFPSQLGMSSSWDENLLRECAEITAKEVVLTGLHWTFSPILCLGRDIRWGRIDETFGEDPYLAGVLGKAMIEGYQGKSLSDTYSILACAKHFVAYGESSGGRDSYESEVSERKLRSVFFPPFKKAAMTGSGTFMIGYEAIDGTPCSANEWLLNDVLAGEWEYQGIRITDWNNVGYLYNLQKITDSFEKACEIAIKSGNDMIMSTPDFYDTAVALVKNGIVKEELIDKACLKVLTKKFELGLFDEKRYPDKSNAATIIGSKEHIDKALEIALHSMVLLKNDGTLPLKNVKKIALIGPNAADVEPITGDWCFGPRYFPERPILEYNKYDIEPIVTVLKGLKARIGSDIELTYAKGCDCIDPDKENITEAVKTAIDSDLIIAVIGDTMLLNGETRDRATLDLTGSQNRLLKELKETGKPLVVVMLNGKPLTINWVKENANAILEAWNPGIEGGTAIAKILFGDFNPCGKLSITFPKHVGAQPSYYNQFSGWHGGRYIEFDNRPLFHFGFGLSYTKYKYSNLLIENKKLKTNENLKFSITIENTGNIDGYEIVQVYINDIYSSVTTPIKVLKAFKKVFIKSGEKIKVQLTIQYEEFALIDKNCKSVVEKGDFEIMVGSSSDDADLIKDIITID
jgi:beta-glucosidase